MAVFVDLDDENEPPEVQSGNARAAWGDVKDPRHHAAALRNRELRGMEGKIVVARDADDEAVDEEDRPNPNRNVITQALGCYP
jgi:hypothetical protein